MSCADWVPLLAYRDCGCIETERGKCGAQTSELVIVIANLWRHLRRNDQVKLYFQKFQASARSHLLLILMYSKGVNNFMPLQIKIKDTTKLADLKWLTQTEQCF